VFSRFFIDRPVFASVLSIVITLAGLLAMIELPVAQFPPISPPNVSVSCNYPGASAQDVAEAVAAPIEQQVNGVEGMMYMSSQCTNDGSYSLSVTFHQNIDGDMAQVLVQNRVALAMPNLPDVIKATGITTRKRSPDIVMGVALVSMTGEHDALYLSNFAQRVVVDELLRVPGVSDITVRGQRDCSMRVWVDPAALASRSITAMDVVTAIREQNLQIATGMIGQPPTASPSPPTPLPQGERGDEDANDSHGSEVALQMPLDVKGRLDTAEEFGKIIVKTTPDGRMVRLKDVARVELGAKNEDINCLFNDKETIFLPIFQLPNSNALRTRNLVLAKMDELLPSFPKGIEYRIAFDTTPYTRESIEEVINTLRDAIVLVAIVVLVFLQNWRSAIIPLVAVPVAIIGTFAVMSVLGFSLNNLTLFGLVLSIGIVVDDAIVVVEAVEHHIEHGLPPHEATIKAMEQVSGPVIAVGLVLSAVFIPCAFISGITGQFFRQFALTIAVSTIISAFNSLTLSPALAALLLRPIQKEAAPPLPRLAFVVLGGLCGYLYLPSRIDAHLASMIPTLPLGELSAWSGTAFAVLLGGVAGWLVSKPLNRVLGWSFRQFNRGFGLATHWYTRGVGSLLRISVIALIVYGGLLGVTWLVYGSTPKGFIPSQDMGYLLVNVQLPDSASMERTEAVMRKLSQIVRATPGVRHATTIAGQSFALNASGSNFGSMFVNLKDYADRRDHHLTGDAIAQKLRGEFAAKIFDANVNVFGPPPVRGVGRAGGFTFVLEDRGDLGSAVLQEQTDNLVAAGNQQPGMVGLFSVFRSNVPQLRVAVNIGSCLRRDVSPSEFAETLRIFQGSMYVNDFNLFGRTWQVIVQADAKYRNNETQISQLKVRNGKGNMVPIGALASLKMVNGPLVLTRYNMYPAATINGSAGKGISSRQAIDVMQHLAERELPQAMAYEWTDMSYLELRAGSTAMLLFMLAVLMVFLVLAAQYESWSLPLAVILVVPLCILSAIIGVKFAGMDINIFTQIGLVVLVGLSSKNAILIVEFAKSQREAGVPRLEATLEACKLRLRPIIMTSLAFILGVVPMMNSHGAGSEMRRALGVAVFSGMVGVTLFGIFLTPVFYYVINWIGDRRGLNSPTVRLLREVTIGIFALGYVKAGVARGWRTLRR